MTNNEISYVKSPSECTYEEIDSFHKLVLCGGQVDKIGLINRIKKSKTLAFYYIDNQVVSVAALKSPNYAYKSNIFIKAGIPQLINQYKYEIGYAYTSSEHRRKGICSKLISKLIANESSSEIYVSTGNPSMASILKCLDFERIGNPYQGLYSDYLGIYVLTC